MHLLLPYFILILVIIQLCLKNSTKKQETRTKAFIEKERQANSVRKKNIENLNYITIPDDIIQIEQNSADFHGIANRIPAVRRSYDRLLALQPRKILNLTGISNTDLKLEYGVANLTALTEYDDNFTELIRCISNIGHHLLENGDRNDAIIFLEFGIKTGGDIRSLYTDLAEIYIADNKPQKLEQLKLHASGLKSLNKDIILEQLTAIQNRPETPDSHILPY